MKWSEFEVIRGDGCSLLPAALSLRLRARAPPPLPITMGRGDRFTRRQSGRCVAVSRNEEEGLRMLHNHQPFKSHALTRYLFSSTAGVILAAAAQPALAQEQPASPTSS